ncbi:UvrB/UvrC motif-containing protein [Verrucomicrobiaceae bacterium N1E253]|uniref:UvrB/UvrC motif-containing protein n=1 Tax=Oceaniferula marina TaxID=2748318 RepID=A0A851GBH7_9BACT|nr:UvrB/UvrC motif-containing protein [Oceaniferula marina]NWK54963.1 UvrB/UvrC motif-containing protein [Oceaniferula marina]
MQCDYCESKATVFFTQIIDGQTKKSSLCEQCATEQGVTDPEGFLIGHLQPIPQKTAEVVNQPENPVKVSAPPVCPGCGFAFDDLKKTGRLGCSECYQFFREDIKHNLGGMHKGISHKGRVPKGMLEAYEKQQQIEKLHEQMTLAIQDENYEKAAALRDELRQLEQAATPDKQESPAQEA